MERFIVTDGVIYYGDTAIGPATALYKDSLEKYSVEGSIAINLPHRIDLLFVAGDKVVGLECKKTPDLITSWKSRKLQRQLRTLRDTCDIQGLVIRPDESFFVYELEKDMRDDLLKFQVAGGYIAFGPIEDEGMEEFVCYIAGVLRGEKNLKTILAGEEKKWVEGTAKQRALQRMLRGVGRARSHKLLRAFKSITAILSCTDEAFLKAGGGKQGLESRNELL